MAGRRRLQPRPNGPLPEPESYESDSCGPNPDRPGGVAIGRVSAPVPVAGLAVNFSSIPRMVPPPFGRANCGAAIVPTGRTPPPNLPGPAPYRSEPPPRSGSIPPPARLGSVTAASHVVALLVSV